MTETEDVPSYDRLRQLYEAALELYLEADNGLAMEYGHPKTTRAEAEAEVRDKAGEPAPGAPMGPAQILRAYLHGCGNTIPTGEPPWACAECTSQMMAALARRLGVLVVPMAPPTPLGFTCWACRECAGADDPGREVYTLGRLLPGRCEFCEAMCSPDQLVLVRRPS